MDPGVAKLLERSRARRGELKEFSSDRSPLPSEKTRDRSPLKQINRAAESSSSHSARSPRKTSPVKNVDVEDSPSNTIKRILSRESLENNVRDLISRDSPGKTGVTKISPVKTITKTVVSPNKTTYTKTVITEKEEKYEKKEIISYSGSKKALDNLKEKFDNLDKEDKIETKTSYDSGTFTKKSPSSTSRTITITREETVPLSPSKTQAASPDKSHTSPLRTRTTSPVKSSPLKTKKTVSPQKSKLETADDLTNPNDEFGDWESGRKARLANLANKFKKYDDDEEHYAQREIQLPKPVTKPPPRAPSPSKHAPVSTEHLRSRSPVKASPHHNPNQFISPVTSSSRAVSPTKPCDNMREIPARTRSVRFVSPTKRPERRSVSPCVEAKESTDAGLMESLKAQGFQESDSKSKLVYKFNKDKVNQDNAEETPSRSPVRSNTFVKDDGVVKDREKSVSPVRANPWLQKDRQGRGRSPTKKPAPASPAPRSYSPEKTHPLQFVSPAHAPKSPVRQERGRSPVKKTPQPRSYSPEKPHPLQFVTPGQGPPKPSRTFENKNQVKSVEQETEERVDSQARMSLSAKREMFETGAHLTPEPEKPDPAMMSLSQRKALFEKNKSVPTPIARFGESVTPAMLAKNKAETPAATPSEAWKRKRAVSPSKDMIASAAKHEAVRASHHQTSYTPQVPQPSAQAPAVDEDINTTPQVGRKTGEMHKKLFEANNSDWRDNDIAKKAAEEKKSEMNLLLNRYNHLRKHGEESNKKQEETKEEPYYPGVNSMKRVKMSPPKPGSLYPQIDLESGSERPESVMSTDSYDTIITSASEAPSMGKDIVTAARIGAAQLHDQVDNTVLSGVIILFRSNSRSWPLLRRIITPAWTLMMATASWELSWMT